MTVVRSAIIIFNLIGLTSLQAIPVNIINIAHTVSLKGVINAEKKIHRIRQISIINRPNLRTCGDDGTVFRMRMPQGHNKP